MCDVKEAPEQTIKDYVSIQIHVSIEVRILKLNPASVP